MTGLGEKETGKKGGNREPTRKGENPQLDLFPACSIQGSPRGVWGLSMSPLDTIGRRQGSRRCRPPFSPPVQCAANLSGGSNGMALREGLLDVAHPTFVAMTSPLACGMTCKCHRLIPSLSRKHVCSQLLPSCAFGYSLFSFSFLQGVGDTVKCLQGHLTLPPRLKSETSPPGCHLNSCS